jgi:hypothetical protein
LRSGRKARLAVWFPLSVPLQFAAEMILRASGKAELVFDRGNSGRLEL